MFPIYSFYINLSAFLYTYVSMNSSVYLSVYLSVCLYVYVRNYGLVSVLKVVIVNIS
jgi:hypothetical protein